VAQVVVFEGPLESFTIDTTASDRAFDGTALDGWTRPGSSQLSTAVYQGKRTGDLIGIILDAIGWPADKRSLDAGATVVPYWWAEGVEANTAVTDLVHSEGVPAIGYVRNGTFVFRDRHHRVTRTTSLTSQGTYTHIQPAGPIGTDHKILKRSFHYDHGLDYIINSASLEVTPRLPTDRGVVWSSDSPIALGANASVVLVIRTDDPFIDLQVPSAAVTYLDDGGVLTADYRVAAGSATITLSRTSGQSAFLTITAGGSGVFLDTGIKVRGTALKQGSPQIVSASDAYSQQRHGVKDWDGAAPWAGPHDAQAIVGQVVAIYSQPMPSVTFDVDGVLGSGTLTRILATDVSDRITVRSDEMGLNADFTVERVDHEIRQLGVRHVCTIGAQLAEPTQASVPFMFDVAGQGFNAGQFTLDVGNNPTTMFRFDTAGQGFNAGVFAV
jgi:hypothetical protein